MLEEAIVVWSGALTFGLVTVPVSLYSAVDEHTVRFHQVQRGTSDRVRIRRVNERTGKEVAGKDIVKGYELGEGRYVLVEPDELHVIAPGRSQTIDVSGFVELAQVKPVYFAATYNLTRPPRAPLRQIRAPAGPGRTLQPNGPAPATRFRPPGHRRSAARDCPGHPRTPEPLAPSAAPPHARTTDKVSAGLLPDQWSYGRFEIRIAFSTRNRRVDDHCTNTRPRHRRRSRLPVVRLDPRHPRQRRR
ncbi:Ku protein [Streptomyces syringium]|uniref:Ku protein n=1 Tax=Streptomyces syringium TaxID=76729 RepID=UPI0036BA67CC